MKCERLFQWCAREPEPCLVDQGGGLQARLRGVPLEVKGGDLSQLRVNSLHVGLGNRFTGHRTIPMISLRGFGEFFRRREL